MPKPSIITGGQTGVDRAVLDAAMSLGFQTGGWCPKGRIAEDGRIADKYPLRETKTTLYAERTEKNVVESDATLILSRGPLGGGTEMTAKFAVTHQKPLMIVNISGRPDCAKIISWLDECGAKSLNVAGPRESSASGVYRRARLFMEGLLAAMLKMKDKGWG